MLRTPFFLVGLCLLSTLGPGAAVAEAVYQQEESPEVRLRNDLAALERASRFLDTETKPYLPAFRAVLTRIHLDRASATANELELARAVRAFASSREVDPLADLQLLKAQLKSTPGIKTKPQVVASQRKTPGGGRIGVVTLNVGGRKKVVAEIIASAGGLNPGQRAQSVARRLGLTHQKNPLWWTQIKAGMVGKDYVVASPQAPGGYVITADANYARERGLTRERLAHRLVNDIRTTYDTLASDGRATTDLSADEQKERRREEAVERRLQGDAAYHQGKAAEAEALYQQSLALDPSYAVAYRRLAGLYAGPKQSQKRHEVLRQALAAPGLEDADRREIEQMLRK
jgi:tetratricopeptide (TPR) repeat protein